MLLEMIKKSKKNREVMVKGILIIVQMGQIIGPFFYLGDSYMITRVSITFFFLTVIMGCQSPSSKLSDDKTSRVLRLLDSNENEALTDLEKSLSLDSIIFLTFEYGLDSLFLEAIFRKSNLHYNLENYDSIQYYDSTLLKEATDKNSPYYLARAYFHKAYNHSIDQQLDSAFFFNNLAKNNYEILRDSSNIGKRLLSMGIIQKNRGDFYGAKETLTEAIINLEAVGNSRFLASSYNELGTNHKKLLNFQDAIKNYKKAIATSRKQTDINSYKNNLALVYMEQKDYQKSIALFEEVIKDSSVGKRTNLYARVLHNLTDNYYKNNGKANHDNFLKALNIRKSNNDFRGLVSSYYTLAEIEMKRNKDIAEKYLDSLISVSKKIGMPEGEIDALEKLMMLRPKNISFKDRYIFLKDSLYEQELKVKSQFAKMKYDDEQEKARLLVLETETAQKEAQLAQQKTQKVLYLSLSALLLLGGVSLYFILRQRHKKERLQEVYNTEKRIAEVIHDSLSNDVFSLMTKIQNEPPDAEEFLGNLEHIYKTSRRISHDNAEIQTGPAFKEELKNLIRTYQGRGITVVTKGLSEIDWSLLNEHQCIALHRTINEMLVNMIKHSKASLVSFTFEQQKNKLLITYTDNGIGIHPEKPKGIGLKNTVSRMKAVGSVFTLVPKKIGQGVKAEIAMPL